MPAETTSAKEAATMPRTTIVSGGPASGKTQTLVDYAKELLETGCDPSSLLVLCASPEAASQFGARLAQVRPDARDVRVATVDRLCLDLLATPAARAATGRRGRMLAPFEETFLIEDLKVSGLRPKRVREMFAFFCKGLEDLRDEDPSWLVNDQERELFSLMKRCLASTGGILRSELAGLVLRWLRGDARSRAWLPYTHVMVDDWHAATRSGRALVLFLARGSLAVAVDGDACETDCDELLMTRPDARVVELDGTFACPSAAYAASRIVGRDADGSPTGTGAAVLKGPTREDELDAVAERLRSYFDAGIAPSSTIVAVPRRSMCLPTARHLESRGIPSACAFDPHELSGDVRQPASCEAARVLTGLYLVADPHDEVSWRSWYGFGDWLTNSNGFAALRDGALGPHGGDAEASLARIAAARKSGMHLVEAVSMLRGIALLECLSQEILGHPDVPRAVLRALEWDEGLRDLDAAQLAERAQLGGLAGRRDAADAVLVADYRSCAGLSADVLVVCDFVNGYLPLHDDVEGIGGLSDEAMAHRAADMRLLRALVGEPTNGLAFALFGEAPVDEAQERDLKIERVLLRKGRRMARIAPSDYLAIMTS